MMLKWKVIMEEIRNNLEEFEINTLETKIK